MKGFLLSLFFWSAMVCALVIKNTNADTVVDAVLPRGAAELLESAPLPSTFSVSDFDDAISEFSTNVSNLRPSATSFASTLLSAQVLHQEMADLLLLLRAVKEVDGVGVGGPFLLLEEGVEEAMVDLASLRVFLESVVREKAGTEFALAQVRGFVQSIGERLSPVASLPDFISTTVPADIELLRSFEVDGTRFSLSNFGAFVDLPDLPSPENVTGAIFTLTDDLTDGDLNLDTVLRIVDTRGGFILPVHLPSGEEIVRIVREGGSVQNLDLANRNINGEIDEAIRVGLGLELPNGGSERLDASAVVTGEGVMGVEGIHGLIDSSVNLQEDLDLGAGLGSASLGFGDANIIDGTWDNSSLSGSLLTSNALGGGFDISGSPILNGGGGFGGEQLLTQELDLDSLTGSTHLSENLSGGAGLTGLFGNSIGLGGGTNGDVEANVDVRGGTADVLVDLIGGAGGVIGVGGILAGGGGGADIDLDSAVSIPEGTADLDFSTNSGVDGAVQLPGRLGGLMYDIQDSSAVSGHVDLKDLSTRSLEILKQTDILVKLDMPGDMQDVDIELHPTLNLSNLGNLNVLGRAQQFAIDVNALTEFNMLDENSLLRAIGSGVAFLDRLHIIDALRNEIGAITNLPDVARRVRAVLADMISIVSTLRIVKVFPQRIRELGEALRLFDIAELDVELPQLEALSAVPGELVDGLGGFTDQAVENAVATRGSIIPIAAADLSDFSLGTFLSTASIVERLTEAVVHAQELQKVELQDVLRGSVGDLLQTAPSSLSGLALAANGLQQIVSLAELSNVANQASLDLNQIANVDEILGLAGVDSSFADTLTNIIQVANVKSINLNDPVSLPGLGTINLANVADVSELLRLPQNLAEDILYRRYTPGKLVEGFENLPLGLPSVNGNELVETAGEAARQFVNSELAEGLAKSVNDVLRGVSNSGGRRLRARNLRNATRQ